MTAMDLPDPETGEMDVYDAQQSFETFTVTLPGQLLELKGKYDDELAREGGREEGTHTDPGGTSLFVVELVEEILANLKRQGHDV
jgi:hypothetical protein